MGPVAWANFGLVVSFSPPLVEVEVLALVAVVAAVEPEAPTVELDFEPLDEPHPQSATTATHASELTRRVPIRALTLA